MQIRVRLFATLRQQAGWAQQLLDVPEGTTLDGALAAIDSDHRTMPISCCSIPVRYAKKRKKKYFLIWAVCVN